MIYSKQLPRSCNTTLLKPKDINTMQKITVKPISLPVRVARLQPSLTVIESLYQPTQEVTKSFKNTRNPASKILRVCASERTQVCYVTKHREPTIFTNHQQLEGQFALDEQTVLLHGAFVLPVFSCFDIVPV